MGNRNRLTSKQQRKMAAYGEILHQKSFKSDCVKIGRALRENQRVPAFSRALIYALVHMNCGYDEIMTLLNVSSDKINRIKSGELSGAALEMSKALESYLIMEYCHEASKGLRAIKKADLDKLNVHQKVLIAARAVDASAAIKHHLPLRNNDLWQSVKTSRLLSQPCS